MLHVVFAQQCKHFDVVVEALSASISLSVDNIVDVQRLKEIVLSGRVYQQRNFLNEDQVLALRGEIEHLETNRAFSPSGLSITSEKDQSFDAQADRGVCPVPWWTESLLSTGDEEPNHVFLSTDAGNSLSRKLHSLRQNVSHSLARPTMSAPTLAHECYYSSYKPGTSLSRHLDERHEDMKGARGWLLPSRRSISWLIYLSDAHVQGGALRSYPQRNVQCTPGGCHNGNIQLGWVSSSPQNQLNDYLALPVYLDSWYKKQSIGSDGGEDSHYWRVLYTTINDKIAYITHPWSSDVDLAHFFSAAKLSEAVSSSSPPDNTQSIFFTRQEYAKTFRLIEDRASWLAGDAPTGSYVEDIVPERGSLVLFDSVALPHEVLVLQNGRRDALAGWFHEETQSFPEEMVLYT